MLGRKTVWLGEAGQGSRMKLAVNAYMSILIEGVAEALELAGKLNLDAAKLDEAIEADPLDAPIADAKLHKMERGDFAPEFPWSGRSSSKGTSAPARPARFCRSRDRGDDDLDSPRQMTAAAEVAAGSPARSCLRRNRHFASQQALEAFPAVTHCPCLVIPTESRRI